MNRVLLVDDHQLIRQSLKVLLESGDDLSVRFEAADGLEAVDLISTEKASQIDIIVMDVSMPNLDGIEAARRIHFVHPEIPVLILTMHDEPAVLDQAIAAGVSAFVTKDVASEYLLDTVRRVLAGEIIFPPRIAANLRSASTGDIEVLSTREIEVLQLIADGHSTEDAAQELFISVKTVKNHLASAYSKLGARDRTQAVLEGLRAGILRLR